MSEELEPLTEFEKRQMWVAPLPFVQDARFKEPTAEERLAILQGRLTMAELRRKYRGYRAWA